MTNLQSNYLKRVAKSFQREGGGYKESETEPTLYYTCYYVSE